MLPWFLRLFLVVWPSVARAAGEVGRALAEDGEASTSTFTRTSTRGDPTTTSTTTPPEGQKIVTGILRFSSSREFRGDEMAETQVKTAFKWALRDITGMAEIDIAVQFASLSVRRVRRLAAYVQAEYWLRCPDFWQALVQRDRLSQMTLPETQGWSGLEQILMQQLYRVGQPLQISLLGHYVNRSFWHIPPEVKQCPRNWATLDEQGLCMSQAGAKVASGFVSMEDCCFVCADLGEKRYAPADGRTACPECGRFEEVNSEGNGCELRVEGLLGLIGPIAGAGILALILLCGCGPLLPPLWLWILDARDVKRRGRPCRCGRGVDCTCDLWKGRLCCYYSRCSGGPKVPQGHWVLNTPGKGLWWVHGEVCPRCRKESCSFSEEENLEKTKNLEEMGGSGNSKTQDLQQEASCEAWDNLKVECNLQEGKAAQQCFFLRDDQENVKVPPEWDSVNSKGQGQAYESESAQAVGPKSPYGERGPKSPHGERGPKSPYSERGPKSPYSERAGTSPATPHATFAVSPAIPVSHKVDKVGSPKSQGDVLAECQRDDSTIESPRDSEESLDLDNEASFDKESFDNEPSFDNDNGEEVYELHKAGEEDEDYEQDEDYEEDEGDEAYEIYEGDEGNEADEAGDHMGIWDSLVEAFENVGEDFEADLDDMEDLVMPTTEPR